MTNRIRSDHTTFPTPGDRIVTTQGLMLVTQRGRKGVAPVGIVIRTGEQKQIPGSLITGMYVRAPQARDLVAMEALEHQLAAHEGVPLMPGVPADTDDAGDWARARQLVATLWGAQLLDLAGNLFQVEEVIHHLLADEGTPIVNAWSAIGIVTRPNPEVRTFPREVGEWTALTFDYHETPQVQVPPTA